MACHVIRIINDIEHYEINSVCEPDVGPIVIPTVEYLKSNIGDEDYDEVTNTDRLEMSPTKTWFWCFGHGEVFFVINENYKQIAMEFKLRYS